MPDSTPSSKDKSDAKPAPLVSITPNPVITSLLALPNQPAKSVELLGFLGPVDANGIVRLYLALDLCACYQFPQKSIIFAEASDPADPTKPTKVLVDETTNVEIILNIEASILQGAIPVISELAKSKKLDVPFLTCCPTLGCAGGQGGVGTKDEE